MTLDPWQVLEAVAAVGNLAYTVLMLYEKRVGWLFGIAASAMGVALFLHQHVYAQVGLSAYYVAMGIYGWWSWGKDDTGTLAINRRSARFHAVMIIGGGALAVVGGLLLKLLPDARYTGLDGFATAFSLLATWLLARKVLENWAYWIVADAVAIVLYALLGMYWYAGLYLVYVVISASALKRWHGQWKAAQPK
jgi:nicotinamide mononucleotide transporter